MLRINAKMLHLFPGTKSDWSLDELLTTGTGRTAHHHATIAAVKPSQKIRHKVATTTVDVRYPAKWRDTALTLRYFNFLLSRRVRRYTCPHHSCLLGHRGHAFVIRLTRKLPASNCHTKAMLAKKR